MILYLTYNDQPSGVYWSQVTDVVAYLNGLGGEEVRLVALVSIRDIKRSRTRIKKHCPTAWVLPMVPQMKRWRANSFIVNGVCRLLRPKVVIARGVMATALAHKARKKGLTSHVCFDGRGAYAAEWEEYRIIDEDHLIQQFRPLEDAAVIQSDFRIAVSNALVEHWRKEYSYTGNDHVVIPCTLGSDHEKLTSDDYHPADDHTVRLVYSGSTAGWQSFDLLEKLLSKIMDRQPEVCVLFLSKKDANNQKLMERYPERVKVKWVKPVEVKNLLATCDHGILIREQSITNRVASPTKFAEYLAAGLPVIISEGLGDFSALVKKDDLGTVLHKGEIIVRLEATSGTRRKQLAAYAQAHFSKCVYEMQYRELIGIGMKSAV